VYTEDQDIVGIEADVDAPQILQGTHQESRAYEDNYGEGDLGDHQGIADAEPFSGGGSRTRGAALAFLESRGQIDASATKGGSNAEKDSGEQGNGDGESEDAQVAAGGESEGARLVAGDKGNNGVSAPI